MLGHINIRNYIFRGKMALSSLFSQEGLGACPNLHSFIHFPLTSASYC